MSIAGIICEYNPFHRGHLRQMELTRAALGGDCALVCLMSGSYVQRGEPALFPKSLRAQAALSCGADLILELPLTLALSSAEGFAAGGVSILSALGCGHLSFGAETDDWNQLLSTAEKNLDPAFDELLRDGLRTGVSYARARAQALEALGAERSPQRPNDILGVEYCKALLRQHSPMKPLLIHREGDYHALTIDGQNPSATALRRAFQAGAALSDWGGAVPACLRPLYESAPVHSLAAGERALLAVLRSLPEGAFRDLPYGAEGLWSRFMKACRRAPSVEAIVEATKSKRYARSRVQRMLLCAFLGLSAAELAAPPPYVRVLGFNDRGRSLLRAFRPRFPLLNAGEKPKTQEALAYYALEERAERLYELFSVDDPAPLGQEASLRPIYFQSLP